MSYSELARAVSDNEMQLEGAMILVLKAAQQQNADADLPIEFVDSNGNEAFEEWVDLLADSVQACAMQDFSKMMDVPTGWQVTAKTVVFVYDLEPFVEALAVE